MHKEYLNKIKEELEKAIQNTDKPQAAFDADGTLWQCDVGKDFFHYQIQNNLLKDICSDPRAEFNKIKEEQSRNQALLWLAQVQVGIKLETMQEWVRNFLASSSFPVFEFQQELIHWLLDKKVEVFVVSSSLKWVLDQALPLKGYPIDKKNIIGVETVIEDGKITDKAHLPAPIHRDKVGAFQKNTGDTRPIFVSGNTLADQALLELATHIRLVISTAPEGGRNRDSERNLLEMAKDKKWFYYDNA